MSVLSHKNRVAASLFCLLLFLSASCCACQPARRPLADSLGSDGAELEQLLGSLEINRLQQHAAELTAGIYAGREVGTDGERRAAAYLSEQLAAWQLEPWRELGLDDFTHDFELPHAGQTGRNVIAVRKGSADQWLLLVAHYDHLGVRQGDLYPGADDNAAAVAILLEAARCFSLQPRRPERNIVFVFTSGEEQNLSGSKALVELLKQTKLSQRCRVVNLDMLGGIGGNSLDVWRERSRPSSKQLAHQAKQTILAAGLKSNVVRRRFGAVDSRSFAQAGIPSITLSWAYQASYHPHRHLPTDTADELKPELMQRAAIAILRVVWMLANAGK